MIYSFWPIFVFFQLGCVVREGFWAGVPTSPRRLRRGESQTRESWVGPKGSAHQGVALLTGRKLRAPASKGILGGRQLGHKP